LQPYQYSQEVKFLSSAAYKMVSRKTSSSALITVVQHRHTP
jgi:hypothetical protein